MSIAKVRAALRGISGIHVTPCGVSGDVNVPLLAQVVSTVTQAGVHNIVSCGNTGEFFALTDKEVQRIQAVAAQTIADRTIATALIGRSLARPRRQRAQGKVTVSTPSWRITRSPPSAPPA